MSMRLNKEEEAMLRGEHGAAVQEALQFQIEVGDFFGAERFVPITNAHVMGDIEVMGDGGLGLLREMAGKNATSVVPTPVTRAACTSRVRAVAGRSRRGRQGA